jgi:hypothetical protein
MRDARRGAYRSDVPILQRLERQRRCRAILLFSHLMGEALTSSVGKGAWTARRCPCLPRAGDSALAPAQLG